MTSLIRVRAALWEMAALFDAVAEERLTWRELMWPGDRVLTVRRFTRQRQISTMPWGLPANNFVRTVGPKQRGVIFARDLVRGGRLAAPSNYERCLIIVEAFAYPAGERGSMTRNWFGRTDGALNAWAALCAPDGSGCAGLLTVADPPISLAASNMPRLLEPVDFAPWLSGAGLLSLASQISNEAYYFEDIGEAWSSGECRDHGGPLR